MGHRWNAFLWRGKQGLESQPLPGNCAESGEEENCSSSTSWLSSWGFKTKEYDLQRPSQTSSNTTTTRSRKQQLKKYKIQEAGGVLLLFEGYDELPEEICSEKLVFLNVITGRVLPQMTVLITSRPWASEFLHRVTKNIILYHSTSRSWDSPKTTSSLI